jgi:hypothetical protein
MRRDEPRLAGFAAASWIGRIATIVIVMAAPGFVVRSIPEAPEMPRISPFSSMAGAFRLFSEYGHSRLIVFRRRRWLTESVSQGFSHEPEFLNLQVGQPYPATGRRKRAFA